MRKLGLLLLGLLPATASAENSSDEMAVFDRLSAREQILDAQRVSAETTTRQRGLLAYRLCRQRELGFATNPENRLDDARAFDLALVALQRGASETSTLAHELDRVRSERTAVEAAFVARAADDSLQADGAPEGNIPIEMGTLEGSPNPPAMLRSWRSQLAPHAIEMGTLEGSPNPPAMLRSWRSQLAPHAIMMGTLEGSPNPPAMLRSWRSQLAPHAIEPGQLFRPVRGEAVALPGSRRDGSTKVELRHAGAKMLARLNEPVRAISGGTVRRVEPLPQGGFAVITAHPRGLTSIITGLRDISVAAGDKVAPGQQLGLAGRNLDGAAVVSVELWSHRRPLDAGKLLRVRLGRGS